MEKKLRFGLLGTGRIGQVHAATIAESKDAELVWVADVFEEGATKTATQYGCKSTTDPHVVINSGEVDAIVVATPTNTHVELIEAGINAGLHVLCEKPIDLDIRRVDSLRDKAKSTKTQIALGFNRRFDQHFAEIHRRVTAGEIGALEQLTIISRDPAPAPKAYIAVSGGIFRDMTIHDFDMARFFVPNITGVFATGSNLFSDYIKEEGDYDSAVVVLTGADGEQVTIVNSRHASYGYDQRLEAFGGEGSLFAQNVSPSTVVHNSAKAVEVREPYMEFFLERYAFSYRAELAAFIEGIRTNRVLNPTFEDGRAALVLADAATESAKSGQLIKIEL